MMILKRDRDRDAVDDDGMDEEGHFYSSAMQFRCVVWIKQSGGRNYNWVDQEGNEGNEVSC